MTRRKTGRPRIEDRAKTIEARKPWLKLECRGGHGTAAKPKREKAGSDPDWPGRKATGWGRRCIERSA